MESYDVMPRRIYKADRADLSDFVGVLSGIGHVSMIECRYLNVIDIYLSDRARVTENVARAAIAMIDDDAIALRDAERFDELDFSLNDMFLLRSNIHYRTPDRTVTRELHRLPCSLSRVTYVGKESLAIDRHEVASARLTTEFFNVLHTFFGSALG